MKRPKKESVFEKAYACYPRHVAPRAAEKAWGKAINRESAKCVRTYAEHEDFVYQKVMQYGAACRRFNKEKEFIPYMATWLNQDRFLDDPSEWEVTGNGPKNGNGAGKEIHQAGRCPIPEHANSGTGPGGECWGCHSETPEQALARIRKTFAASAAKA